MCVSRMLSVSDNYASNAGVLHCVQLNLTETVPSSPLEGSTGNIAVAIHVYQTVQTSIEVTDDVMITDVSVSVRLAHSYLAGLQIVLQHPDGSLVSLSDNNGGNFKNMGS